MLEAEGIPPTASTVVPGLSLNYAGDWVFAYSGLIAVPAVGAANTTMLSFNSGNGSILGKLSWHSEATTTEDEFIVIKLNGAEVMHTRYSHAYHASADQPYRMLIPPFTEVLMLFGNSSGTDATFTFTGRVYNV